MVPSSAIQPPRYILKCNVASIFCYNKFAIVCDSFAVTLTVKAEILQVKLIAKTFHGKRIKKIQKEA